MTGRAKRGGFLWLLLAACLVMLGAPAFAAPSESCCCGPKSEHSQCGCQDCGCLAPAPDLPSPDASLALPAFMVEGAPLVGDLTGGPAPVIYAPRGACFLSAARCARGSPRAASGLSPPMSLQG